MYDEYLNIPLWSNTETKKVVVIEISTKDAPGIKNLLRLLDRAGNHAERFKMPRYVIYCSAGIYDTCAKLEKNTAKGLAAKVTI